MTPTMSDLSGLASNDVSLRNELVLFFSANGSAFYVVETISSETLELGQHHI